MKNSKTREKTIAHHINLGYRCKSCKQPIKDKSKWGKPTLCQDCEDAVNNSIA